MRCRRIDEQTRRYFRGSRYYKFSRVDLKRKRPALLPHFHLQPTNFNCTATYGRRQKTTILQFYSAQSVGSEKMHPTQLLGVGQDWVGLGWIFNAKFVGISVQKQCPKKLQLEQSVGFHISVKGRKKQNCFGGRIIFIQQKYVITHMKPIRLKIELGGLRGSQLSYPPEYRCVPSFPSINRHSFENRFRTHTRRCN